MKRRIQKVYKRLPPHTYEAHPLANEGEASKPFVIAVIAIVAIVALSLLLLFSEQLVGKAIYAGEGTAGLNLTAPAYENQDFTLLVKAHVGQEMAAGVNFELSLPPGVSCKNLVDGLNWPVNNFVCDPNKNIVTYLAVTNKPVKGELTVATLTFTGVKVGKYDFKFTKFEVKKADRSRVTFKNELSIPYQVEVKVCASEEQKCGNQCVNLDADENNCGSCGTACLQGETCDGGVCSKLVCGDKKVNEILKEECDDGNNVNTDACVNCKKAFCGDGSIQQGVEECDDKNKVDGDGCSSMCTKEEVQPQAVCGNGKVEIGEACDDNNKNMNDGCSDKCQVELDYKCEKEPSVCVLKGPPHAVCGNNIKQGLEQCDDGNLKNDDGCSASCKVEKCGDNIKQLNEQCDGSDLAGQSCQSQGFANGTLKCGPSCKAFDSSSCVVKAPQQPPPPPPPSPLPQEQVLAVTGTKIILTDVAIANNVFSTKVTATETFTTEITIYTVLYGPNNKVLSIKSEKLENGLQKDATYTATVNYPQANVKSKSVLVFDDKKNPSVYGQLQKPYG